MSFSFVKRVSDILLKHCIVVPPPKNEHNFSAYVRVELFHSNTDQEWRSKAVKVKDVSDTGADIIWNERFEWKYESEELAFIRYIYASELASNVEADWLQRLQVDDPSIRVRKGRPTGCVLCSS